jgi:PAS domain S-box-containing protein
MEAKKNSFDQLFPLMYFRRRSISRNLTISLALVVFLVVGTILTFVYSKQARHMRQDIEKKADEYIYKIAEILALPMWNFDRRNIEQVVSVFAQNELIGRIRIIDASGQALFEFNKQDGQEPKVKRARSIEYQGRVIGNAEIALTLGDYNQKLFLLLSSSIATLGGSIVVIIVSTGFFLGIFLRKPLAVLQRGMDLVAAGDYSYEFEKIRHLELAGIAQRFSQMAANVQTRAAALQNINTKLQDEIAERERAEKELRQSQEKYRLLLMNLPGIVYRGFKDWSVEFIDEKIKLLTGYTMEEFNSKRVKWSDLIIEQDIETVREKLIHAIKTDTSYIREYRIKTRSGDIIWIRERGQIVRNDQGEIEYVSGVFFDITDRMQADQERIRLATAVEQAAESIIISDRPGTIQYVNPAFERLSGFSRQEIVGRNFRILKSDRHDEAFYRKMWQIISQGDVWQGHIINTMKDGSLREFETTISPVPDSSGAIVNFVSVNRDVTQEVILEAQLRHAQKMQAVGTLAGGIAHDFNNLLQAVQGYAELLLLGRQRDEPGYRELQEIFKATKRGAELTRQMLTFGRKIESKKRPIDLNQRIREMQKLLERTIPKMIKIELYLAEKLKVVDADSVQMEQVLMNLALNAKDAMPDGGELVIETENVVLDEEYCKTHLGARPGEYVLLSVSDTGEGMDKEILEHIFEPFYTTKEVGKGTGLGLAMIYGIVKNHDGFIMCYSEPGEGTTFKIYLPAILATPTDSEAKAPAEEIKGGRETILLVDDEKTIRDIGSQILEKNGYTVFTADDGETALEIYRKEKDQIELVLLDLIMPGMGGRKCLEELLKLNSLAKIVIVTGYSVNGPVKEVLKTGPKGFINKPYDSRHMLKEVRRVLDQAIKQ